MDYNVKFAQLQSTSMIEQTLFKTYSQWTENNSFLRVSSEVCSFSPAFQSARWGTWKEYDCTKWRRFRTCVILVCMQITLLPELTLQI